MTIIRPDPYMDIKAIHFPPSGNYFIPGLSIPLVLDPGVDDVRETGFGDNVQPTAGVHFGWNTNPAPKWRLDAKFTGHPTWVSQVEYFYVFQSTVSGETGYTLFIAFNQIKETTTEGFVPVALTDAEVAAAFSDLLIVIPDFGTFSGADAVATAHGGALYSAETTDTPWGAVWTFSPYTGPVPTVGHRYINISVGLDGP